MNKNTFRLVIGGIIILLSLFIGNNYNGERAIILRALNEYELSSPATSSPEFSTHTSSSADRVDGREENARLIRVIDGDTIRVAFPDGREETIRYIGIDAPELSHSIRKTDQCYAKEALIRNQELLSGQFLILSSEVSNRDKYGRLLRDVYSKDSNGELVFVAYQLVRGGFAVAWNYPPDSLHKEELAKAQTLAKEEGLGRWRACDK